MLSGAISGLDVVSNQSKPPPLPSLSSAEWLQLVGLLSPGAGGESPPDLSVGLQPQLCSCCVDLLSLGVSLGSFLQEPGATSASRECVWLWCALSFCNLGRGEEEKWKFSLAAWLQAAVPLGKMWEGTTMHAHMCIVV